MTLSDISRPETKTPRVSEIISGRKIFSRLHKILEIMYIVPNKDLLASYLVPLLDSQS